MKLNGVLTKYYGVWYERAKAIYVKETYPHKPNTAPRWYIVPNVSTDWHTRLQPYIDNTASQTDWHKLIRLQADHIDTNQVPSDVARYIAELLEQ